MPAEQRGLELPVAPGRDLEQREVRRGERPARVCHRDEHALAAALRDVVPAEQRGLELPVAPGHPHGAHDGLVAGGATAPLEGTAPQRLYRGAPHRAQPPGLTEAQEQPRAWVCVRGPAIERPALQPARQVQGRHGDRVTRRKPA